MYIRTDCANRQGCEILQATEPNLNAVPRAGAARQCSLLAAGWSATSTRAVSLRSRSSTPQKGAASRLAAFYEDDVLGEELQVVWEIEPGVQVIEKVTLPEPTAFDSPDRLDAFLDAVRWGAASTAHLRNIQARWVL